jgi:hypothetical protein
MKPIVGALAVALLLGCSHKRQPLDNRDPCLDFGPPESSGFKACLDRRAQALKDLLEGTGRKQYQIVFDEKVDP